MKYSTISPGGTASLRYNRRRVVAVAATFAATLLPAAGHASPLIIPTPTPMADEEIYRGDGRGLTVTWNPALWQIRYEPVAGTDGITLCDTNVDAADLHADKYYFQIGYLTKERWTTVDDVRQNAIDDWFNLSMLGSTVIQKWDTADAYSWFYTSETQNNQTLNYMEYSAVDAPNAIWRWLVISIDNAVFNTARAKSLLAGITVDNEAIPRALDADRLVTLFDQYA
ncbi:MAG TPA: hypothetical protein VNZ58_02300 [Thermomicrobiales bacterium]|nr:hypothetical protein [Thermomicrobiales bacterium]